EVQRAQRLCRGLGVSPRSKITTLAGYARADTAELAQQPLHTQPSLNALSRRRKPMLRDLLPMREEVQQPGSHTHQARRGFDPNSGLHPQMLRHKAGEVSADRRRSRKE